MFLIRCSILNYVNADIEESQYYISQDLRIVPYYLIAFQKIQWSLKDDVRALSSIIVEKTDSIQAKPEKEDEAINCYGSVGK